jgi:hypothetical protein
MRPCSATRWPPSPEDQRSACAQIGVGRAGDLGLEVAQRLRDAIQLRCHAGDEQVDFGFPHLLRIFFQQSAHLPHLPRMNTGARALEVVRAARKLIAIVAEDGVTNLLQQLLAVIDVRARQVAHQLMIGAGGFLQPFKVDGVSSRRLCDYGLNRRGIQHGGFLAKTEAL